MWFIDQFDLLSLDSNGFNKTLISSVEMFMKILNCVFVNKPILITIEFKIMQRHGQHKSATQTLSIN